MSEDRGHKFVPGDILRVASAKRCDPFSEGDLVVVVAAARFPSKWAELKRRVGKDADLFVCIEDVHGKFGGFWAFCRFRKAKNVGQA